MGLRKWGGLRQWGESTTPISTSISVSWSKLQYFNATITNGWDKDNVQNITFNHTSTWSKLQYFNATITNGWDKDNVQSITFNHTPSWSKEIARIFIPSFRRTYIVQPSNSNRGY